MNGIGTSMSSDGGVIAIVTNDNEKYVNSQIPIFRSPLTVSRSDSGQLLAIGREIKANHGQVPDENIRIILSQMRFELIE